MIIGLSGYARTGKDTVADILVKDFGFKRIAFADKLRDVLYALNPYVINDYGDSFRPLQEVINHFGWDTYKDSQWGPEIRRLLQRLGTEAGRQIIGEDVWVDAAFNNVWPEQDYVITDARYPNEAKGVKRRYGMMWRIERPGVGPINDHASEVGLDDWHFDYTLQNDGTLYDLFLKVHNALEYIK